MLPCNSSVIFVLHDYEAKYCSWWGHLCVCPTQLDHQQEPFKLCMHNLAHPTNNSNSQERLLEREEEGNEFRDQFITIVNKRYCFSSIRI